MEIPSVPKLERVAEIHKHCRTMHKKYFQMSLGSNDLDECDKYCDLSVRYNHFEKHCYQLAWSIKSNRKFGEIPSWFELEYNSYIRLRAAIKAERRAKFESSHCIVVWFGHTSLNADYGSFCCEKCGCNFYHSPSSVKLGRDKQYNCICGECVNFIVTCDGGSEVFS
jgi:hypothetical protein